MSSKGEVLKSTAITVVEISFAVIATVVFSLCAMVLSVCFVSLPLLLAVLMFSSPENVVQEGVLVAVSWVLHLLLGSLTILAAARWAFGLAVRVGIVKWQ